MSSAFEDRANLVPAKRVIHDGMNAHAIEENRRCPTFTKRDVQATDQTRAIFKRAVSDANVWADRQLSLMFQRGALI